MLGNFSFGDYFKPEAIEFAWDFLTNELELAKDKLCVTVYHTDDEAVALWKKIAGLNDDRIIRISTDDNFWSMGNTGPCGPCSEIFYDHGPEVAGGPPGSPDEDGDRFVEIWNLVFMQFEKFEDGTQQSLPAPCIDTGSGLERIAAACQGVTSNYDTDIFQSLIKASQTVTGNRDPKLIASHRVIADHLRTSAFLIAEGVLPSNEGRGYVLRRIMRRAMRHLHLLGTHEPLFHQLVQPLVDSMGQHYGELASEQSRIEHSFKGEEEQFRRTLDRGMRLLQDAVVDLPKQQAFPGDVAFKLYDTYGFPLDLTQDVLRAQDIEVDVAEFDAQMQVQKDRARQAWSGSGDMKSAPIWLEMANQLGETNFVGYEQLTNQACVVGIVKDGASVAELTAGDVGALLFDTTVFYAESGGQVGDLGNISGNGVAFSVTDTQKPAPGLHAHIGELTTGHIKVGDKLQLTVDAESRSAAAANHSATHLLHAALREHLGEHVVQKGSYVGPDRLRFDFAHNQPVTLAELRAIETRVNQQVTCNATTDVAVMPLDDALATGAMAMFDEKYADDVRVLRMGQTDGGDDAYSIELCGGTHVQRGGDIGLFKILSEASVGAGVRRIEAVTNQAALTVAHETDQLLAQLADVAKSSRERLLDDVSKLVADRKRLTNELKSLKEADAVGQLATREPETVGGLRFVGAAIDGFGGKELKDLTKRMLDDNRADVVCLLSSNDKNTGVIVGVNKTQAKVTPAKELLAQVMESLGGGGGGGSPTLAQGATKQVVDADAADSGLQALKTQLE